ncbi:T9SS type A sorting domain-containing protein [Lacibacter sp. H407]|uniref:T9SS type A sorting domain-containing protein n=1 Tax=Lacibacter sp. H407 TaxID=3133423 RepID=UPI0030C0DCC0
MIALFLIASAISNVHAQVNMYTFGSTNGNTLETSGSFTNLLGSFMDDDASALTNIGFVFNYGGANYTDFSVTSNGLFQFGGPAVTDFNNVIGNLVGPYLVPYWDDNYTDADGFVQYQVTGAAGSRKLIVDYHLSYLGNTGAADKRFQIWLFETTNAIMFVYGNGNDFNGGFSIAALTHGTSDFISINSTTHASNIATAQDNNTVWPGAGTAYSINGSGTLPVTLTHFAASCIGKNALLQWTTGNEENNSHFVVERSSNAQSWKAIAEIKGAGSTSTAQKYMYSDETYGSKLYYRLRQVDYNGKETISQVVTVNCSRTDVSVARVYPNPVQDVMRITGITEKTTYSLVNTYGQVVKQGLLTQQVNTVNVSALPSGLYYLKLQGSEQQIRLFIHPSK